MMSTPAYTKEWLQNNRILCYRLLNTQRKTIEDWESDLSQEILGWPPDKTWRLMIDVSAERIVSAYALVRARKIANLRPELHGRLAVLIRDPLAAQIISMAIRNAPNRYRQRSAFANEALAIGWLLQDH
jgi:hypothetical protein